MLQHSTRRRIGPTIGCLCAAGLGLLLALHVTPALAADPPPKQSAKEADLALKRLMENRAAIQGKTRRGQTLDDAPPFKAVPRKPSIGVYPCSGCHDNVFIDGRVRDLKDEHTSLKFEHGGGRFWCYDACHNGRDMDHLVSIRRRPIDYDEAYKLCGQCHFQRFKDWNFGGHGRRAGAWPVPRDVPPAHTELRVADRETIGTWQGERTILSCPACHNPHSPSIKPYTLSPPPLVRSGLKRAEHGGAPDEPIWVWVKAALGGPAAEQPAPQAAPNPKAKSKAKPQAKQGEKP
jgi:hypothetical protein